MSKSPTFRFPLSKIVWYNEIREVTRTLIGGGGGVYSYIHVLPDESFFRIDQFEFDLKRNSSGRT